MSSLAATAGVPSRDPRGMALPPPLAEVDTDDYQSVPIDIDSSEHDEPLVDLRRYGIATEPFYAQSDGLNAPLGRRFRSAMDRVYARRSVAVRLRRVNQLLRKYGVELLVWDGYRPVAVQSELWQWMLSESRCRYPDAPESEQIGFALRYASDPTDFSTADAGTWPTHATGGAVDLTLRCRKTRAPLFMGGIYLDPSAVTATRHYEDVAVDAPASHLEARRNRRLLYWVMSAHGFVNYAFEWWHFDYLTQAWVMNQGSPDGLAAHYGLANEGMVV